MSRYLLVAAQAYGDNVVAMRLLRELRRPPDLALLGTPLTGEIAGLLGFRGFPIHEMDRNVTQLYDIGGAGLPAAARAFFVLRRALADHVAPGTEVLFTSQIRPGTHRLLQLTGGGFGYHEPRWGASAYADRVELFERVFGERIELPAQPTLPARPRKVLVAPTARKAFRDFPPEVLAHLLDYLVGLGCETTLLDPAGQYAAFRERVTQYVSGQPLAAGFARLQESDGVICGDSLFLHLAYAIGRPAIALVPERIARAFYFAPPGLIEKKLFLSFERVSRRAELFRELDARLQA